MTGKMKNGASIMSLHQSAFKAITLSVILSACGGESTVSEVDQVANMPGQQTVVSDSNETATITPPEDDTTFSEEETTTPTATPTATATATPTPGNSEPVEESTDAEQSANQVPEISGNPSNSVDVGDSYSFTPGATDSDNDDLTFSVTNLPAWAQFDNQSGTLSGTPTVDDVGDYNNIVITVSDGTDEASLNAFAITVNPVNVESVTGSISLRWVAPTTRTDGSELSLSEIQGYCIYVGTTSDNLEMIADLNQSDIVSYELSDLELGDYYVAVTVYDQQNVMSGLSNVVMKTAVE
jgi:hypothetical protein